MDANATARDADATARDATVITAFYPLEKSKHTPAHYTAWINNFCRIPCRLVVATDEATATMIRAARGDLPTEIIVRPFTGWEMTSPQMMALWKRHYALDPERTIHSPELYAVWALKQEVVMETIRRNPFNSTWFIWCDIGIQRHPSHQEWYQTFPDSSVCKALCLPGQMVFLEVKRIPDPFIAAWKQHRSITSIPSITLGGGCIAGDVAAWSDFSAAYKRTVAELDVQRQFAGKDQGVFFRMLIGHATAKPFRLIVAAPFGRQDDPFDKGGDPWMCMPVILGGKAPAHIDGRFSN